MILARLVTGLACVFIVVLAAPGIANADPPGPTDYITEVTSVTPSTSHVTITIEGGDTFVYMVVEPGHDVIVFGYHDEPYLRVRADGVVEQNRLSFATYYNSERFGGEEIPGFVDNSAPPDWESIGTGGAWAWHDHRAHWMGEDPPIGLGPGDSLPSQTIPIEVDGDPISVEVLTTLQPSPSLLPTAAGVAIGLAVVAGAWFATQQMRALITGGLAGAALFVGGAQFVSLPAPTDPKITWWLLPALALGCSFLAGFRREASILMSSSLLALAALQLLVWAAQRSTGITSAILPTDLPFWFDRFVTSSALVGATGLLAISILGMFRSPSQL